VGIRKTLGSAKKQLVIQFFSESIILAFIAFIFSIVAVLLLLPSFNLLVDKKLTLPVNQIYFWIAAVIIIVFTGIVAGSYPALFLSSFNPVKVLKGTFVGGKKAILPRRILVVGQFAISILLISATIIVYQQIQFIKNRHIGYNPDNLIMMPYSADIAKNFAIIKQELLKSGIISSVTRTSAPITSIWWRDLSPDYKGKPANSETIVTSMTADVDFTKTMGIKIIEGSDFSGSPSDSTSMILNKAAVSAMGLENPVGMKMRKGRKEFTVIGITDNVIMESPFKPVDPMVMYFNPRNSSTVSVRLKEEVAPQKALALLETVFKKYNPAFPFEYQFVDQEFGKKFLSEERISKITNIFAALAIFICCLGVAGLAAFTIQKRIREIGIRKVLGASFQQLLLLISTEFLRLVVIAFIIAVPLAWWFMDNWLQKYDFKVNISIWLFGFVGFIILLLTLFIVGLNTMRAVMANPVKSLRTE
jgi:ABC-type antimicrobial peptide transport system permease subunit